MYDRLAENLCIAFGTENGRIRSAGSAMRFAPVGDATLRRWVREGYIRSSGDLYTLTRKGEDRGRNAS